MMMAATYLSGGVNITMTNRMPITTRDKRAGRIVISLSRMWLMAWSAYAHVPKASMMIQSRTWSPIRSSKNRSVLMPSRFSSVDMRLC